MNGLKFALIGDGVVAKYHRKAIEHVGGEIVYIFDPKYNNVLSDFSPSPYLPAPVDYVVICSPSFLHRSQIKIVLETGCILKGIICEKPAFLPWEPIIDDNRINIVLQLRYLPNLPEKADLVSVRFVRDEAYFKSWKGDARNTGGLFYNLFIHAIDLAIRLGADFKGIVAEHGEQEKWIGTKWTTIQYTSLSSATGYKQIDDENKIDILNIDTQACYNKLYDEVLAGNGIKPSDIFYLNWILQRNSEILGYGRDGLNKTITIKNELM